jgi:hypothetical protein
MTALASFVLDENPRAALRAHRDAHRFAEEVSRGRPVQLVIARKLSGKRTAAFDVFTLGAWEALRGSPHHYWWVATYTNGTRRDLLGVAQ